MVKAVKGGSRLIQERFHVRADLPRKHHFSVLLSVLLLHQSVGGIVVSIAAFLAVDLGSIPGRRNRFCHVLFD